MFAIIAGKAGTPAHEIAAMSSGLPGLESAARGWQDESGWFSAAAALTNILPEDTFDNQPFIDADLVFVCQARLDSRSDLLKQLEIDAARGARLSDGDILRRCYRKWGQEMPQHVYGDFAFVAWERAARRIVAGSDNIGTFPLFYCQLGGRLLISNRLSALLAHPALHPTLNIRALGLMAAAKLGWGWTMFEGLQHLPGGELLIYRDGELRTEKWWRPDTTPRVFYKRPDDYVEDVRVLFDAAVATRLRARGEIAATLSGGLDSTLVATTAARQMTNGRLLHAFTAVPEPGLAVENRAGWDADDAPWAAAVAALHPNIRHTLVPPGGVVPLDLLPVVHAQSRTPIRNTPNLFWSFKISELAKRVGASVVLCGDHGNASFSYPGDVCDARRLSARRCGTAWRAFQNSLSAGHLGRRLVAKLRAGKVRTAKPDTKPKLRPGTAILLPEFCADHHDDLLTMTVPPTAREIFVKGLSNPGKAPRHDSMAQFGVEWRDPTGDRRLLERLLTFPLHAFLVGNRPRGLARELGRGLLPDSVRLRQKRGAQAPDQAAWFALRAQDYRNAFQTISRSPVCGRFLCMPKLEAMIETLCAGNGSMEQATIAHRALDAGLFAVAFETGTLSSPAARLEMADHR